MITTFLVCLTIFDVLILAVLYFYINKKQGSVELLEELTEERLLCKKLKDDIQRDAVSAKAQIQSELKKIMLIAAEVERDAKTSKENLSKNLQEVIGEFSQKLEDPMLEFTKRQHMMENLLRKMEFEKSRIVRAIQKGEKICQFFNKDLPYEELLKDIELKKYDDARKLLLNGYSPAKVALELGMRVSEIELLHGTVTS